MHREMGRPSLAESLLPETLGQNVGLERIDDGVDWDRFSGWWPESTQPVKAGPAIHR